VPVERGKYSSRSTPLVRDELSGVYQSISLRRFSLSVLSWWHTGHREQWQPWDQSGVVLHETTGLRRHDAAVLSLVQMDFALGSAIRIPGRTDQGVIVQLPPLVKTEAVWSVDEDGILVPDTSATILAFGGKTRSLGTLHSFVSPNYIADNRPGSSRARMQSF
jgi:hypothetical protein